MMQEITRSRSDSARSGKAIEEIILSLGYEGRDGIESMLELATFENKLKRHCF